MDTTPTAVQPLDPYVAGVAVFFDGLQKLDKGRLAVLRRNVGNSLSQARGVSWFYELLNRVPGKRGDDGTFYDEEIYFLAATLFAFDKDALNNHTPSKTDLGGTLRRLRQKKDGDPLDRRFSILLDAHFDPRSGGELPFRLRQTVKRIVTEKDPGTRINWPRLLVDLKNWNNPTKSVQKRWARSYYAPLPQPDGAELDS